MSQDAARIALIGLRGAGKSSVGRALAELGGWPFVDLDRSLAELASRDAPARTAGELLAGEGEARFRQLESEVLSQALREPAPLVLATGGGVVLRAENRELLAAHCRCIWLDGQPERLLERIRGDGATRPALTELGPLEELRQQAAERRAHYAELAELRLDATDGSQAFELARVILARISD